MTEFHLLVDDIRSFQVDAIARTAGEGREYFRKVNVTHLYLDHDLGDERTETGYDFITWVLVKGYRPRVFLVTANPVGRQNIEFKLKAGGYTRQPNGVWVP